MTPTERAMIFEFPLCSMLMRIRARRALVRHGHSRQVYLSVSDAGILYHLTLLGIFFLTLERILRPSRQLCSSSASQSPAPPL